MLQNFFSPQFWIRLFWFSILLLGTFPLYSTSFFPDQATAIMIQDAETGTILYQENPKSKLLPASVTKLFTSSAILHRLGPEYRFKTELYVYKKNAKSQQANLTFTSVGDPSFTATDFKKMLAALYTLDIKTIDTITFVLPPTQGPATALGWTQDSLPFCYATPVDPWIMDHNCFTAVFNEKTASFDIQNTAAHPLIDNQIQWISEDKNECIFEPHWQGEKLLLQGCLLKTQTTLQFALPFSAKRLSIFLKEQLDELHLQWNGHLTITSTFPADPRKLVFTHLSAPLNTLIEHTLLHSDNLYAEFFLRQLALQNGQTSSFKNGLQALKAELQMEDLNLEDGSGCSHYNQISAEQLAALLRKSYKNHATFAQWLHALPQAGKTGSLASFLKNTPLAEKLFAKTGTLTHVNTIAGYFEYQPQRYWIVVILTMGSDSKVSFYKKVNNLIQSLYQKNNIK